MFYDPATVKAAFSGVVGWRQNPDATGPQLAAGQIATSSGLYFNDVHPLLKFPNLYALAPEYSGTVGENGTAFSAYLQAKTDHALLSLLDRWLHEKTEIGTAAPILENVQTPHVAYPDRTAPDRDRLAGLTILNNLHKSSASKFHIRRVGLCLEQSQSVTVYFLRNGDATAFASETLNYTGAGNLQWFDVDISAYMPLGGFLRAFYDQSAVTGSAIELGPLYADNIVCQSRRSTIYGFEAEAGTSLGERFNEAWVESSYGLALDYDITCDFTEFITDRVAVFRQAWMLQVAADMLHEMALNPSARINRLEGVLQPNDVLFEIHGDTQGRKTGLGMQIDKALAAIQFDRGGIDPACLPCRKRGAKIRAV